MNEETFDSSSLPPDLPPEQVDDKDLLEDLRSVGAPESLVESIERLLTALRAGSPLDDPLADLQACVASLDELPPPSQPGGRPKPKKRERFWR